MLPTMGEKRPSWDEYFLKLAEQVAWRSRDTHCQVGAVIAREGSKEDGYVVLATGHNGFARGVEDDDEIYQDKEEKLRWMVHAEANAIFNAARVGISLNGATIYVTKFPCIMCANAIIQVGIKRVYTLDGAPWKNDPLDENGARALRVLMDAPILISARNFPGFGLPPAESA